MNNDKVRQFFNKILEAAIDGQDGSVGYAFDRLAVIRELSTAAINKLNDEAAGKLDLDDIQKDDILVYQIQSNRHALWPLYALVTGTTYTHVKFKDEFGKFHQWLPEKFIRKLSVTEASKVRKENF